MAQVRGFLALIETANDAGEAVAVMDMMGLGRSCCMLAMWMIKMNNITGLEAIKQMRWLRPGSLNQNSRETIGHKQAVIEWAEIWAKECEQ